MSVQILKKDGKPEWAVLPYDEYRKLLDAAEVSEDVAVYRAAKAIPEEELVPAEVVNRILDGESAVTVWREHRGMTQAALAKAAGLSTAYVSQIEAGKRVGTVTALRGIAKALNVGLDELAPSSGRRARRLNPKGRAA
ncbi:MAG: helix-turn-helix domain-containing protein [Nitrospirota bacterium]